MTNAPVRFLHVANGDSTTGTIAAAGIPGMRSLWCDPLHEGPVPGGLSDDQLLEVRARVLAGPEHTQAEVARDLRRWRSVITDAEYDELVLWFEHDLFDQLNLIHVLSWIRSATMARPVSLVCIGSFPGRPNFKGLGELTPQELAPLLDARQLVTSAQYAVAERAWDAYRAPTPEALSRLLQTDTSPLPFLAAAIRRFLEEYPWTVDGLSRFERHLLQLTERGPIALADAFPRMQEDENAYYMTGSSLDDLAGALAATSPPLLTVERGSAAASAWPLQGMVTLTGTGRDLLAGKLDRVELCGIDKWLGGVHLTTEGPGWRWSPEREQIVSASAAPPPTFGPPA